MPMLTNEPTAYLRKPPVLLVTGGDSSIGLEIARKFAESGYRVAIGGLDRRRGDRVVTTLRALGADAGYFHADVRSEYQIRTLIRRVVQRFGRIDVLCNNAGIRRLAPIDKFSTAQWNDVMAVNARAVFFSSKYGLPISSGAEERLSTSLQPPAWWATPAAWPTVRRKPHW